MEKKFIQTEDWHIKEKQSGKYLGEVFVYENETQIWIKDQIEVPEFLKRQLDFGFAVKNHDGYIVVPSDYYYDITEFDFV